MVIPLNPHQFIANKLKLTKGDGSLNNEGSFFMQSLFQRTGGASGIPNSAKGAITAAGINQSSATLLTDDFNHVTQGTGGVVMKNLQPGQLHWVHNATSGNLNVYPASSGQINALAVNAPYVLAAGTMQIFWVPKLLSGTGGTFYKSITLG